MDQVETGGLIRNRRSSSDNQWVQASNLDPERDIERETSPCNNSAQNNAANTVSKNNIIDPATLELDDSVSGNGSCSDSRHVRLPLAATSITAAAKTTVEYDLSHQYEGLGEEGVASSAQRVGKLSKAIRSRASYLPCKIISEVGSGIGVTGSRKVSKKRRSLSSAGNKSDFDNDHDDDDDDVDNSVNDDCSSDTSSTVAGNNDSKQDFGDRREYIISSSSRLEQGKPVFVRARRMQPNGQEEVRKKQALVCGSKSTHQLDEPIVSQETDLALANNYHNYHKLGKVSGPVALKTDGRDLDARSCGSESVFGKPILSLKNTWWKSSNREASQSTSSTKISDINLDGRQNQTDKTQAQMPSYHTLQVIDGSPSSSWGPRGANEKFRDHRKGSNGYTKLNHHQQYYTLKSSQQQTIFRELLRLSLLLLMTSISCFLLWKLYVVLIDDYNYLGLVETPSKLGIFKQYAVATDAEPCAKVGEELLAKGGSAVDASIGTLLCMGVVIPNSLGLGGGCLMTLYDAKKKEAIVIDGREIAPDYSTENMFANDSLAASRGPLSIGIPGELAAYWKAHQMFGKLPWAELFNRSIDMAENGCPTVEHLAYALRAPSHAKYITPPLAKLFLSNKTGEYIAEGELFVQKELANTLRRIRDFGSKEFYGGLTGQKFIKDLETQGGKITLENLMKYEALVREPLTINLDKDLMVFTQPPPGSGIVLSVILRIMKEMGYYKNLKPQVSLDNSTAYYHRLTEAFKFAYGQRAALEDQPDPKLMEKLMSDDFIKEAANKIDYFAHDNRDNYYGALQYFSQDHGTAHVSVLDSEGNAAAITTSVNLYFGSGLVSPSTGIIYNDVMDDFVSPKIVNKFGLAPSRMNRIRPGKRPLSSMAPSVFTDGDGNVKLIIGGSGGSKITTAIASVCIRNCFLGEDIKTAIDGPRIHHQFLPNSIYYEENFPRDILQSLVDRGHSTEPIVGRSSVIMAIASDQKNNNSTRCITANSDYRKGGSVAGL